MRPTAPVPDTSAARRLPVGALLAVIGLCAAGTAAAWELLHAAGHYGITVAGTGGDRLLVYRGPAGLDLLLEPRSPRSWTTDGAVVRVRVDRRPALQATLAARPGGPDRLRFELVLSDALKVRLMNEMIAGIGLVLSTPAGTEPVRFGLEGFTAALNELLIANELGTLDLERLFEQHRDRELLCLFAATVRVQALLDRRQGLSLEDSLARFRPTGIEALDHLAPELARQAYDIPAGEVPLDPRADRYGLFRSCMDRQR